MGSAESSLPTEASNAESSSPSLQITKASMVLCYGDSLTAGFNKGGRQFNPWGPVLQEKAGCAAVTVCGGSGLTACEMLQKSKRMSIFDVCNDEIPGIDYALDNAEEDGFPYDLCIIMVGTNDLGHDYKPHEVFESVVGLHQTCHRHGVPTIAISIPPNSFTHGKMSRTTFSESYISKWKEANQLIRDWATTTAATTTAATTTAAKTTAAAAATTTATATATLQPLPSKANMTETPAASAKPSLGGGGAVGGAGDKLAQLNVILEGARNKLSKVIEGSDDHTAAVEEVRQLESDKERREATNAAGGAAAEEREQLSAAALGQGALGVSEEEAMCLAIAASMEGSSSGIGARADAAAAAPTPPASASAAAAAAAPRGGKGAVLVRHVTFPVEFADEGKEGSQFWEADGLHMSAKGYTQLGTELAKILACLRAD